MTEHHLARTPEVEPGTPNHRAWLAGGLAAAVAGIAIAAMLVVWHPGGDPGGRRQDTLHSITVALPSDAKVQGHSVGRTIWDSCDGRPGTQGWTDAVEDYQFTSARSAPTVVAGAAASMKIAGWTLTSTSTTPLGPSRVWSKIVSGGVVAQAQLSVGTRGPTSPPYWEIAGKSPPAGRRVSGC